MKRISGFVIGIHIILILWMTLWMPTQPPEKKILKVRTISQVCQPQVHKNVQNTPQNIPVLHRPKDPPKVPAKEASPLPSSQKPTPKPKKEVPTTSTKPVVKQPKQLQKSFLISEALIKELQTHIAKMEEKNHKEPVRKVSQTYIPKLQIDSLEEETAGNYTKTLIQYFEDALELPEEGEIKLELTLQCDGTFSKIHFLEIASVHNQNFLEKELKMLKYPPFTGPLKQKKEHTFVITFCNH